MDIADEISHNSESTKLEENPKIRTSSSVDYDTKQPGTSSLKKKKARELKPGIIHFSTIPPFMTAKKLREMLGVYGEIGRIFLQPEISRKAESGKKRKRYTEGWVEFKDRKVAKRVAVSLNNTLVGGKRRSKYHDSIWNMKYLKKFQWLHLTEQLSYETAVRKQKMRMVEAQAKRESNFFQKQIEKGENLKKLEEKVLKKGGLWEKYQTQIAQKKSVGNAKKSKGDEVSLLQIFT